jgi:hypothetical protein
MVSAWIESAKLVVQSITQNHKRAKHSTLWIYRESSLIEKPESAIETPYMGILDNAVLIVIVKWVFQSGAVDCSQC